MAKAGENRNMKIEFYSEKKLKKEILNIIGKYLDLINIKFSFLAQGRKGKILLVQISILELRAQKKFPWKLWQK